MAVESRVHEFKNISTKDLKEKYDIVLDEDAMTIRLPEGWRHVRNETKRMSYVFDRDNVLIFVVDEEQKTTFETVRGCWIPWRGTDHEDGGSIIRVFEEHKVLVIYYKKMMTSFSFRLPDGWQIRAAGGVVDVLNFCDGDGRPVFSIPQ